MDDYGRDNYSTDIHCPPKCMKIKESSPSWMSTEIIEELYLKDDLYKDATFSSIELDWVNFHIQNKRVKKLMLEAKEEYTKEPLEPSEGNPRTFWRCINELSGLVKIIKKKKQ